MKIYYAHSLHLYNTKQEERDVELLESLGFEVLNPNKEEYQKDFLAFRDAHGADKSMEYFENLIDECGAVAFRAHPDGKIPSGVGYEVRYGILENKFILELPTLVSSRYLSVEDTREYLKLLGQR